MDNGQWTMGTRGNGQADILQPVDQWTMARLESGSLTVIWQPLIIKALGWSNV
ncbi:MAG: hypothetical protein LBB49_04450 [Gracilibacteraceae bacterium]|nr:hypothetical protein [Gracilibacteraceae bacterium]